MPRSTKKLAPKPVLDRAWKASPSKVQPGADKAAAEPRVEGDYHILVCPACSKEVKVTSAYAGRRMGCGYCKAPLEIIEPALDAEELAKLEKEKKRKGSKKKVAQQPLEFRELSEEDLSEDFDLEFADEYDRRRLPFEAPLWDDEKGERVGPGKKLLTRNEQVFRNITVLVLGASFAVLGVIIYSAVFRTVNVANQDHATLKELPAEIRGKILEVTSQKKPIGIFLTSAEETAAVAVVNGFLEAPTVDDRLPFVRAPQRVRPLMQSWYAKSGARVEWPEGTVILRDKVIDKDRFFIRLAVEFPGVGHRIFAVEQTMDDFKLDWETAIGYQPVPLAKFEAERPTMPVEFRVKVKPSEYYNYDFGNRDRYRAVELSYPGHNEFKLIGYIERSKPWAPGLIKMLDAGMAPSLILAIRFPEGESEDKHQVEIMSIVADSWWL